MNWGDIKPWVAKFAPMLGATLGGPMGAAAGALIGKALGVENPTPEKVMEALKSQNLTPEQMVELRRLELEHTERMEAMGFKNVRDLEELAYKDRDSARTRQVQLHDKTPQMLAYLGLAAWTLLNGSLMWMAYYGKSLPVDMSPLIMRVLGTMDALLGMAFGFFFGTTASSQKKDWMLHQSQPVTVDTP